MDFNEDDSEKKLQPLPATLPEEKALVSSTDDAFAISSDNAVKVAGVVVAILYLVSGGPIGPLGIITMAAAIVSLFVPDLFPQVPSALDNLSGEISALIIPAIEQSELKRALSDADAHLRANTAKCQKTIDQFKIWLNSTNAQERQWAKENLQADYTALTRDYVPNLIGQFTGPLFRGVLIPQYVASAAVYLPLLISYYHHGEQLGITPRPGFLNIQTYILDQFRRDLAEICDTTIISYKNGLQKIIDSSPYYPRTWIDYNHYRNTVTRTGLDLLPTLTKLDPVYYPTGCSARHCNRRLYIFLDTSYGDAWTIMTRNIARLEKIIATQQPVANIEKLKLTFGRFSTSKDSRTLIDGIFQTQVTMKSIDGFSHLDSQPQTGHETTGMSIDYQNGLELNMVEPCIKLRGRHWNGTMSERNIIGDDLYKTPYIHIITALQFITPLSILGPYDLTSPHALPYNAATNVFESSFPPVSNLLTLPEGIPALSTQKKECLSDFRIIDDDIATLWHYAFTWTNLSALQSLSPTMNHEDPEKTPIEQFHAIKAMHSIKTQSLKIINGPGFTGGDLVEVPGGGKYVKFELKRSPGRWFNGFYRLRLWVINPNSINDARLGAVDVDIFVTPGNSLASRLMVTVPAAETVPDLDNIKYADLTSILVFGRVLIPAWVDSLTLEFRNITPGLSIILDRIEFTFDSVATLNDISQANNLTSAT